MSDRHNNGKALSGTGFRFKCTACGNDKHLHLRDVNIRMMIEQHGSPNRSDNTFIGKNAEIEGGETASDLIMKGIAVCGDAEGTTGCGKQVTNDDLNYDIGASERRYEATDDMFSSLENMRF